LRAPRTIAVLAATAALALLLAACGEKKEPIAERTGKAEKIDLELDFYVNPDHAGIYTGIERGYFDAAGLEIDPHVPSDPAAPIKQVAAGRADLAISYEPEVLLAREQGLPVTAVTALVNKPLTSLISLPAAGISTPADLAGKKVATAGIPYQEDYLDAIVSKAGIPSDKVGVTNVGLNLMPALLSGEVDAILGGFANIEGVDLALRGAAPVVKPVSELGVPTYNELVLVANSDKLDDEKHAEQIRLFISALALATKYAAENPAVATEAVLKSGSGLDPTVTAKEIEATLPLLFPPADPKDPKPYGYMDEAEWETFAGFLAGAGALKEVPAISDALTNEYLPPTG
jgi:putative hydroxymethylpyrimidine transport system substrate-binding protein